MTTVNLASDIGTVLQICGATYLLTHNLPSREPAGIFTALRIAAVALLVSSIVFIDAVVHALFPGVGPYGRLFVTFGIVMVLLFVVTLLLRDTSPWPALFCCTAAYAVQNLASGTTSFVTSLLARSGSPIEPGTTQSAAVAIAITLALYTLWYLVFVTRVTQEGLIGVEDRRMALAMVIVLVTVIGFDTIIKGLDFEGISLRRLVFLRLVHGIVCLLVLYLDYELLYSRRLAIDVAATEHLLRDERRQLEVSKENIDAINDRVHLIRHTVLQQLSKSNPSIDRATLQTIAREIDVFDSKVDTGNETLDIILYERTLLCSHEGITLTCIADGSALDFMKPADLYTFFCNAIDNAIEAAELMEDPSRRSISLVVGRQGQIATVHLENYYEGKLRVVGDVLIGEKRRHRLGLRTMRTVIDRYDGSMTLSAEDGTFMMSAIIPIPE